MGSGNGKVQEASSDDGGDEKGKGKAVGYDPKFKGPIADRGCTDIICCLLFVICFLSMIIIGLLAFTRGDPKLLLYPTDSEGNLCGYGDFQNQPNLYFFDMLDCAKMGAAVVIAGCPTPQVCVESCPTEYWAWPQQYATELVDSGAVADRSTMICEYDVVPESSSKDVKQLVEAENCAPYTIPTTSVVGRCIPAIFKTVLDKATALTYNDTELIQDAYGNNVTGDALEEASKYLSVLMNAKEYGMKVYQDVRASWWLLLIGVALTMVIAFIWIMLLRCVAGIIIWVSIFLFVIVFGFTTAYTWYKWYQLKDEPEAQLDGVSIEFTTNLDYYLNLQITWLVLAIASTIILVIVLLIIIFLRNRLRIAIALIKETSRAVGSMMFILLWPLIPFVLLVILVAFYVASALFLASSGTANYGASNFTVENVTDVETGITNLKKIVENATDLIPCDPDHNNTVAAAVCSFLKYGDDEYTVYLQIWLLFMFLWVANFIVALGEMVMAGTFASFYWAFHKPQDVPAFPVLGSVGRTLRYHVGTIAFGSLIIAIIQMIRIILEYLDRKLKDKQNKIAQFIMCCLKCFFYCLEKFMKFINRNAYILTAVHGYNFCRAAIKAFQLILRNVVRVVVLDKVTDFLMFISKLVIVGIVGALAFLFFSGEVQNLIPLDTITDYIADYTPQLNFYLVPVVILIIAAYLIASAFLGVYTMGVDTLFLCFLEDLERNDGSSEKPYYMNKELMNIVGKKNTK